MKVANNEVNKFKRQYEAIDGNWPSYIYIPVDRLKSLPTICTNHFRKVNKISAADIVIDEKEPHISLSKPFGLRFHQIDSFIEQIGRELSSIFKNR
mmetsp:Transcript_25226/g.24148  ORF Transcript_25226/g.24148 Transcript_25226/m.24148 type:complete len:96 (-) Transcript_25226:1-288(-)